MWALLVTAATRCVAETCCRGFGAVTECVVRRLTNECAVSLGTESGARPTRDGRGRVSCSCRRRRQRHCGAAPPVSTGAPCHVCRRRHVTCGPVSRVPRAPCHVWPRVTCASGSAASWLRKDSPVCRVRPQGPWRACSPPPRECALGCSSSSSGRGGAPGQWKGVCPRAALP